MTKKDVARVLNEIGSLLELQGENVFKARAYYNAARTIEILTEDIADLVESGDIAEVKGVGKALTEKISELVRTGRLEYYDTLKSGIPEGLFQLMEIPGLGPKKVRKIWQELEISTVGELEYACHENRLVDLEGFGAKTQDKILKGIEFLKKYQERWLIDEVTEAALPLLEFVQSHNKVIRAELAGSLRRHYETVKDIDLVASAKQSDRQSVMEDFVRFANVQDVVGQRETKTSVRLDSGITADLRLVEDAQFPYALHHFTGSKEHNTALRGYARQRGFKMNEYGLFTQDGENIPCSTEAEIFRALDLHFIPPELRENTGEIEYAQEDEFPVLLTEDDLQGVLHVHTHYSDGVPGIRTLVEACQHLGYHYVGISDHSQSAFYANGLSPDRLEQQWAEIAEVQKEFPEFVIFRGIESDILPDGSLDYDDAVLSRFDFVVASVHSTFNLSETKQTERLISAVRNPYTTFLGHPTGRLLLARDEYKVDMRAVIEAAGETGTGIEINPNPRRLDLDWRWGKLAREHGVKTAINPDAHNTEGLQHMRYGVGIARKGWFTRDDVINAQQVDEVKRFFQQKKADISA
ncbi:MAG TPA: DNA polymerase/3'-5' exonuclease PolX [bacterium]|nr:DNA polymerase/3'-5' exonuclease PolX [bacterium]